MHTVSISNDLTMVLLPPMVSSHDYFGPIPPAPTPAYVPTGVALDYPVTMFWPPGMALGQNQLTTTVRHKGLLIVLDGHDCGALIPHMQVLPTPTNSLTPIHVLSSSRASNFSSSTVILEGQPVAACEMGAVPPAPMTSCGNPVSVPGSTSLTTALNTVNFQMTPADYIVGLLAVLVVAVAERLLSFGDGVENKVVHDAVRDALRDRLLGDSIRDWAIFAGLGAASGVVRLASTDGPGSATVPVGSQFLGVEIGVERDLAGEYSAVVEGHAMGESLSLDGFESSWGGLL